MMKLKLSNEIEFRIRRMLNREEEIDQTSRISPIIFIIIYEYIINFTMKTLNVVNYNNIDIKDMI